MMNFSAKIPLHMKPDDTDWALLAALQHDAAQSNQALAERAGISPPTALRRVRRLPEIGRAPRRERE